MAVVAGAAFADGVKSLDGVLNVKSGEDEPEVGVEVSTSGAFADVLGGVATGAVFSFAAVICSRS